MSTNTQEIVTSTEQEEKISVRASDLCTAASRAVCANAEDAGKCTDLIKLLKECASAADKERRALTDPLNGVVKAINGRFKQITEPLAVAEGKVRTMLLNYQREEDRKAREAAEDEKKRREEEALAKASAEEAKGNTIGAQTIVEQESRTTVLPMPTAPVAGGLTGAKASMKKRWTYRITDLAALAKAHPGCLEVKSAAVMGLHRAGMTNVPGVEFYQEEELAIR